MAAPFPSFDDIDNMFGEFYEAVSDLDPFPDASDTDRTGLDTSIDNLEDAECLDPDDEATEPFEDLDREDVEVGESLDEDSINEVDLDVDPDEIEPDWSPDDDINAADEATDISHEDETTDTQHDDEPYDEWSEVIPWEEISQDDDVIEDDDISQWEEVGFNEPLQYEDPDDLDPDLSDNIEIDIGVPEHVVEFSDIEEMFNWMGQWMEDVGDQLDDDPALDYTAADVSTFHDDPWQGFEIDDGYDPPRSGFMADDMLELGNIADDVLADLFEGPDMGDSFFSWFDSF